MIRTRWWLRSYASQALERYKLTAPFNNMRTLKFKGQPTNAFFATVNQMFGGSSQLPTLLTELGSTMWFDYYALDSSRKLGGAAEHLIDGSENAFIGWPLNLRVRMLLKGAVKLSVYFEFVLGCFLLWIAVFGTYVLRFLILNLLRLQDAWTAYDRRTETKEERKRTRTTKRYTSNCLNLVEEVTPQILFLGH